MKKYIVVIKTDAGEVRYIVPASGVTKAREMVMTVAKCGPADILAAFPKPKAVKNA